MDVHPTLWPDIRGPRVRAENVLAAVRQCVLGITKSGTQGGAPPYVRGSVTGLSQPKHICVIEPGREHAILRVQTYHRKW